MYQLSIVREYSPKSRLEQSNLHQNDKNVHELFAKFQLNHAIVKLSIV